MAYVLTRTGIRKAKAYIRDLKKKRKEILDASKDTCEETELPDIEAIESDVNAFAENGEYFNGWGVTDNYNSDYPLCLQEDIDYVKTVKRKCCFNILSWWDYQLSRKENRWQRLKSRYKSICRMTGLNRS